jgi:hypothetical protein
MWKTIPLIDYMGPYWHGPRSTIKMTVKLLQALKGVYCYVQQNNGIANVAVASAADRRAANKRRFKHGVNTALRKNIGIASTVQHVRFDKCVQQVIAVLTNLSQAAVAVNEYDINPSGTNMMNAYFQNAMLCVAQTFEPLFELNALVRDMPGSIKTHTAEKVTSLFCDLLVLERTWLRDPCNSLLGILGHVCHLVPQLKDPHLASEMVALCLQLHALFPKHPKVCMYVLQLYNYGHLTCRSFNKLVPCCDASPDKNCV